MTTTEVGCVTIRPDRIHIEVSVAEFERSQVPFIHLVRREADYQNQDPQVSLTYDEAEALAGMLLKAAVMARHKEYLTRRRNKLEWARRVEAARAAKETE